MYVALGFHVCCWEGCHYGIMLKSLGWCPDLIYPRICFVVTSNPLVCQSLIGFLQSMCYHLLVSQIPWTLWASNGLPAKMPRLVLSIHPAPHCKWCFKQVFFLDKTSRRMTNSESQRCFGISTLHVFLMTSGLTLNNGKKINSHAQGLRVHQPILFDCSNEVCCLPFSVMCFIYMTSNHIFVQDIFVWFLSENIHVQWTHQR